MKKIELTEEFRRTLTTGQLVLIDHLNKGSRVWGVEAVKDNNGWSYKFELRSGIRGNVILKAGELGQLTRMGLVETFNNYGVIGPC